MYIVSRQKLNFPFLDFSLGVKAGDNVVYGITVSDSRFPSVDSDLYVYPAVINDGVLYTFDCEQPDGHSADLACILAGSVSGIPLALFTGAYSNGRLVPIAGLQVKSTLAYNIPIYAPQIDPENVAVKVTSVDEAKRFIRTIPRIV